MDIDKYITFNSSISGEKYGKSYGNKNIFEISYDNLEIFLKDYCFKSIEDELIEESNEENENYDFSKLGIDICEIIDDKKTTPLILNIVFKFDNMITNESKLYNETFIIKIVKILQEILIKNFNVNENYKELICCVLESKIWEIEEYKYKNIKIQFPYAQINLNYQNTLLKSEFISQFRKHKLIKDFEEIPIGDINDSIITLKDSFILYRSKENVINCPLRITHYYNYIEMVQGQENVEEPELCDIFNPKNHSFIQCNKISDKFIDEQPIEYWIPLFLSIHYCNSILTSKNIKTEPCINPNFDINDKNISSMNPIIMCKYLLPLINIERYNREDYWLDIGKALYNIYKGNIEGLNIWITESEKMQLKTNEDCKNKYNQLENNYFTIKTIAIFARKDNYGIYNKWHEYWCRESLAGALNLTHSDVAEAIYRYFWLEYIYADNIWYYYSDNMLKHNKLAVNLNNDIDGKFIPLLKKIRIELSTKSIGETKMNEKNIENELNELNKLIKNLSTTGFRNSVIEMLKCRFYVDNFKNMQNKDFNKIGWANGITICGENNAYFREGMLEDYITKSTRINYPINYTIDNIKVKELLSWFEKVFPDEELLNFFLKDCSALLIRKNVEKFFRVWVGKGNNSKSMIVKLFQETLGDYCFDFPSTMLCKSFTNNSGPDPQLKQSENATCGFITEADEADDIQGGKIKRHTGGDRFFARSCGDNGGSIDNTYKLFYMCNVIPPVIGIDKAVEDRMMLLPFFSNWSEDAPENIEEQKKLRKFKLDGLFDKKIPSLCQAFAFLMVYNFALYKKEGLKKPKIIIEYTSKYWEENDQYKTFIKEKLEDDKSGIFTTPDLYPIFKTWFTENYPKSKIPLAKMFKRDMQEITRLGPLNTKNQWLGKKIKE